MAVPVITNSGWGDAEAIINSLDAGFVIHSFTPQQCHTAIESLMKNHSKRLSTLLSEFSLETAVAEYAKLWWELSSTV
jgi:hypothetical protein